MRGNRLHGTCPEPLVSFRLAKVGVIGLSQGVSHIHLLVKGVHELGCCQAMKEVGGLSET